MAASRIGKLAACSRLDFHFQNYFELMKDSSLNPSIPRSPRRGCPLRVWESGESRAAERMHMCLYLFVAKEGHGARQFRRSRRRDDIADDTPEYNLAEALPVANNSAPFSFTLS
jgi:hypothetical protein